MARGKSVEAVDGLGKYRMAVRFNLKSASQQCGLSRATVAKIEAGQPVETFSLLKYLRFLEEELALNAALATRWREISGIIGAVERRMETRREESPIRSVDVSSIDAAMTDVENFMNSGKLSAWHTSEVQALRLRLERCLDTVMHYIKPQGVLGRHVIRPGDPEVIWPRRISSDNSSK
jgi:hypothetical protein